MYIPSSFAETDLATLQNFVDQHSFGLLVSQVDEAPFASHLPFLLDRDAGSQGTLIGHLAQANPQAKFVEGEKVLAIFSGAHAYISPTWYEAPQTVPTWNYVAVHAYGRLQVERDRDCLLKIVSATVQMYEQTQPQPWSLDESDELIDKLLQQIIGFRIEIETLEGKWKLNQNHPEERRKKVATALRAQGGENATEIAAQMERTFQT